MSCVKSTALDRIDQQDTADKVPFRRRPRLAAADRRRGAAAVFGLILMVSLVVLVAITLDFSYIHVGETEMMRTADSAAMAGCWDLFEQKKGRSEVFPQETLVHSEANRFSQMNLVGNDALTLADVGDVELGTYRAHQPGVFDQSNPLAFNAVRVTLRRQAATNGELPLFFGGITGRDTQSLQTVATAAMLTAIEGFYAPEAGEDNLEILPFALDLPSWLDTIAGNTDDNYNGLTSNVTSGSDGVCETNLYPKGTGSPGNRGTVDIGGNNNSTNDIARQIVYGISAQDMQDLGKPLKFDANGELELNGDTGISAGVKDELASIIGQTRIIPIYTQVAGNGNNAMYTIVRFEGVRILDVKLTGKKTGKHLTIQPANVVARNVRIDYTGNQSSSHLFAPVMLVD
tara:strand:- start:38733 stop:39938 length:1206 start_codon:yes stop_codon:yes gene_type:complete